MTGHAGVFRAIEHTEGGEVPLGDVEMAPDGTLAIGPGAAASGALASAVRDANQAVVLHAEAAAPDGAQPGRSFSQVIPRGEPAFLGHLMVYLRTYYGIELVPR